MGEKTAAKWIVEYGSLQGLVDNVDAVRGKVGDSLRANLSSVVLNRELTHLVRDVPLAQTPDTLRLLPWGPRPNTPPVRRPRVPGAARPVVRDPGRRRTRGRRRLRRPRWRPGTGRGRRVAGARTSRDGGRAGLAVVGTHAVYDGDATAVAIAHRRRRGRLYRHHDDDRRGRGRAGILAGRSRPRPKALHEAKNAIHDLAGRGWAARRHHLRHRTGRLPGPSLASAASPSTICHCATFVASCALKPLNSNNFRCSTTPRASTTRRSRR